MSELIIEYNNGMINKKNTTGINITIAHNCLQLQEQEDVLCCIPLCNIKEFTIKGYNKIKGSKW